MENKPLMPDALDNPEIIKNLMALLNSVDPDILSSAINAVAEGNIANGLSILSSVLQTELLTPEKKAEEEYGK